MTLNSPARSEDELHYGTVWETIRIFFLVGAIIIPATFYWTIWKSADVTDPDFRQYEQNAKDLASFRMPSNPARPPLTSLLLAATGVTSRTSDTGGFLFAQLLLHAIVVLCVTYILWDLRFPKWVSVGTGALLWLPPFVDHAAYALSEGSSEFLLALGFLGIYWLLKGKTGASLYLAALSCAAVALVQPAYQLLAPFVAGIVLVLLKFSTPAFPSYNRIYKRIASRIGIVFFCAYVLLVGGWSMQNYLSFQLFGLSSMLGYHLTSRTAHMIERLPDTMGEVREVLLKHRDREIAKHHSSHTGTLYIWQAVPELQQVTGKNYIELSRYLADASLWLIMRAPVEYLKVVGYAATSYWFPRVTKHSFGNSKIYQLVWSSLELIVNLLFLFSPVLIAYKLAVTQAYDEDDSERRRLIRATFFIALSFVTYSWAISCLLGTGEPRYRAPLNFLVVLVVNVVLFSPAHVWRVRKTNPVISIPRGESG